MQKSDISEIFRLLDEDELKKFELFLNSPYFHVPERIARLFKNICINKDKLLSGSADRKQLASGILKKGSAESALRKLFSDFNSYLELYISIEQFQRSGLSQLFLADGYTLRTNTDKAREILLEADKKTESLNASEDKYRLMFETASRLNAIEDSADFHKHSRWLQNESFYLDAWFASRKIFLAQLMYSKSLLSKTNRYDGGLLNGVVKFIEINAEHYRKNFPDIYLKYLMLKMADTDDDELIIQYRELLDNSLKRFTTQQAAELYSDLYNYLTIRLSRGESRFREPLLRLYKWLDNKSLLFDSGSRKIHPYTYKQVIDTAIHLNEPEFARDFAERYSAFIDDRNRKNLINLMYAKINGLKGDIKSARINLAKVDYRDFIHYVDSKLYLFCIEYDSLNFDDAQLVLDSTRKYLSNNPNISGEIAASAERFIKISGRLLKQKSRSYDEFTVKKINDEYEKVKNGIYASNWLKQKIEEL